MAKRPKTKTELISVRVPPKLRYGLELVARKKGLTLSEAMMRAAEAYLEADGIAAKQQGEMQSTLDRVWHENELVRLVYLFEIAPNLLTKEENDIINVLNGLMYKWKENLENPDIKLSDTAKKMSRFFFPIISDQGFVEKVKIAANGETTIDAAFGDLYKRDLSEETLIFCMSHTKHERS